MTKFYFSIAIFLFLYGNIIAQSSPKNFKDNSINCSYNTLDGKLHGKYISWHKNGQKKSEGQFYKNNRIGTWKVWDNKGNLRCSRKYKNNFEYTSIIPKKTKDASIKLLNKYPYIPERNKDAYFDLFELEETKAIYSKKYISIILPQDNPILFSKSILELFVANRDSDDFKNYNIFDRFQAKKFEINSLKDLKLIAYKTTKEYVYDLERQIMEARVICISPILLDTITNTLYDDNWFYLENITPFLAKLPVENFDKKIDVQNISDIFFWKQYSDLEIKNLIYQSEDYKDLDSSVFTDPNKLAELSKDCEKNTLTEIENEHSLWIEFTKNRQK
jgi:hypothetical protein